jgi:uncharacterized membrane protein YhhN
LRIYNKYLISLVLAASLINTSLAFVGQNDLEIYFAVNIITYLVITLLYVYLTPRARRALNTTSAVLIAGFMVIVVLEIMAILSGK